MTAESKLLTVLEDPDSSASESAVSALNVHKPTLYQSLNEQSNVVEAIRPICHQME